MRRGPMMVALLMVSMGADDGAKLPGRIDEVVTAAEEREDRLGRSFFVRWKVDEVIKPDGLDRAPADIDINGNDSPEVELKLPRTNSLAWDEQSWRLDSKGKHLYRNQPSSPFRAVDRHFVHVHRDGVVEQLFVDLEEGGMSRGQIFASGFEEDDAFLNDTSCLAVTLFLRPSSIMMFRQIRDGEYEEEVTAIGDPQGQNEICLRHKRLKNRCLFFSGDAEHVCIRAQLEGRMTLEFEYANFENFGVAPKSWTCTSRSSDGTVRRVLKASVEEWHSRWKEIVPLIEFSFPPGTKVTDLRRRAK